MKSLVRLFLCGVLAASVSALAKPVTNADVAKLVAAGMSDDVIVSVISSATEKNFDTSADALAALKKAGASDTVIKAVLGVPAAGTPTAAATPTAADAYEADDMFVVSGGKPEQLEYAGSEIRAAARALGLGGAGVYAVLHGPAAKRTVPSNPTFIIAIPKAAQPDSYVTLAHFAVRKNGDREVLVGNQVMFQFRLGIVKDRVVPITVTKAADQSKAGKGVVLYTITPAASLPAGQYAFAEKLTSSGAGQVTGSFYDFQVL